MRRAVQLRCAVGWDVEFQWSWPLSPQQLLTLEDWKLAIFGFRSEEVYDGICIILSHCILLSFIFFYSSIVSTQYNFITCWTIYVAYIIIIYCNNLYPTIGYYWMMSFTNSHFCCMFVVVAVYRYINTYIYIMIFMRYNIHWYWECDDINNDDWH